MDEAEQVGALSRRLGTDDAALGTQPTQQGRLLRRLLHCDSTRALGLTYKVQLLGQA